MDKGVFKTAGMQRAQSRDDHINKGKQFGIGNFYAWLMQKYPKLTLAQVELKMPQLEREFAQEKAMRKAEPNMVPSVNSAFDNPATERKAKGIKESEIARMQELAGIQKPVIEAETGDEVTKTVAGHTDDERDMIKKQLFQMGSYCVELYKMLDQLPDNVDFPHWWQGKIVKAGEYISNSKHYLENEINVPEDDNVAVSSEIEDNDPSGVS